MHGNFGALPRRRFTWRTVMKSTKLALFLLLATPFIARADQLIPAGALMKCTLSEPKISSRTMAIGDPVLCRVSHAERVGRSVLPYDSYLVGRFEDYRDPGHFVGKGWMELRFDRLVVGSDREFPIEARVVDVPGFSIDRQGRILGKGHPTRDTIEWMIPILWPIDLINLPRRGPRPVLKEETRVTLKVMDDVRVPEGQEFDRDPSGLVRRPSAEAEPPQPLQEQPPQPSMSYNNAPPQDYPAPQQHQQPQYQQPQYQPQQSYMAPQPVYITPPPVYVAPPPVYVTAPQMLMPAPPLYVMAPRMIAPPPMWAPMRSAVVLRGPYGYPW